MPRNRQDCMMRIYSMNCKWINKLCLKHFVLQLQPRCSLQLHLPISIRPGLLCLHVQTLHRSTYNSTKSAWRAVPMVELTSYSLILLPYDAVCNNLGCNRKRQGTLLVSRFRIVDNFVWSSSITKLQLRQFCWHLIFTSLYLERVLPVLKIFPIVFVT